MVCCIHGDETCGWEAAQKLMDSDFDPEKPVKLVLANEKAFSEGERFIDKDLNRSFPGDLESEVLEERLAAELVEELEGLKILDFHSTHAEEAPFAITVGDSDNLIDLAKSTGIEDLIDIAYVEGGMGHELEAVSVELSRKSDDPVEDAYDVLVNFLAAEGLIDAEFERSEPELFKVYDTADGSGFEFTAENFELVEEGEVFARKEETVRKADSDFYPVLMSTDGYDEMVGFKAKKPEQFDEQV